MAKSSKAPQFEQSLAQLEELVKQMESGDLSLEDSLAAFEKGVKLTRDCQTALQSAEQRVNKLVEDNEQLQSEEFEPHTDDE